MTLKDIILNYVNDHKKHFDGYPVDVEVNGKLYTWQEYWAIIESDNEQTTSQSPATMPSVSTSAW